MNLTRLNWPKGWTPDEDAINGNPEGLVRMDNLCLDAKGVLSLIEGMQQIGPGFGDYVSDIFSLVIGGSTYFWIGLNNNGSQVFRTDQSFSSQLSMAVAGAGTPSARACFGNCLGQTLAFAGQMRTKDQVGGVGPIALGILTPSPIASTSGQAQANSTSKLVPVGSSVIFQEGTGDTDLVPDISALVDPVTLEAIGVVTYGAFDSTIIGGNQATDTSRDLISFNFLGTAAGSASCNTLIIQILCDPNPSDPSTYQNYFTYIVDTTLLPLNQAGVDLSNPSSIQVTISRGLFTRVGTNSNLGWNTVTGVRVTSQWVGQYGWLFSDFAFIGGATGQLNGVYNYVQVDVNNNGQYVAMSPPSANLPYNNPTTGISGPDVPVINGSVNLIPFNSGDPQVNEHWFFRKAATDVGLTDTGSSGNSSSLDQYYFCCKLAKGGGVQALDTLSDIEIIEQNIILNPFLTTLRSSDTVNGLQDNINYVEGLINGRMLYMGQSFLYISDFLNPDAIDSRYTLKPSGDANEKNLFIKKIANGSLILATTKDIYEVTGTFEPLPNGIIDVNIVPIGDAFPPLSQDCCQTQGAIFYIASDGLRFTTGQHSQQVSPQLNFLFQGQERHGVPPFLISSGNTARYAITQGHGRVYFSMPHVDGTIRLFTYDLVTNTYTLRFTDPIILHTTPNGQVLAGFNVSTNPMVADGAIYLLEIGSGVNFDGGNQGYQMTLITVFDTNGQPRNRKDTFTLKLILDTGGAQVSVFLQKDGIGVFPSGATNFVFLKNVSTSGLQTIYIPLDGIDITLGFRYALKIVDVNLVFAFKFYEYTIEYDPRPEQLDYMRIQPSNLGTISRKRIVNYAFVIDTLGNDITFTPFIDNSNTGVLPATSLVNTPAKQTYIHYFTQEQLGTDINGILSGGVFEFYSLNLEEIISEKLPVPVKFLVIPANDYGQPNRKRHTSYKFQINTRRFNVKFTPIIDGVSYAPLTFKTPTKTTVEYFFSSSTGDVSGIDIGGILQSLEDTPFEFYGVIVPQQIEVLPPRLLYFVIPTTDYGTPNRKRHTSYKFQINTNGADVVFTPTLDGIPYTSLTFSTNGKRTVDYFFPQGDIIGVDVAGTLASVGATPFEFYQTITPQQVETLPARLEYFRIPNNNFGVAARKRIRTIPIVIDTYGYDVLFTPIVDGVALAQTTILNANGKTTLYHFFATDVFGTDFGGSLSDATGPFEFYELGTPEDVETLPVPKKYDQLGPVRWDKIGKIFTIRVRLIVNGSTAEMPLVLYGDDNPSNPTYNGTPLYTTSFSVEPQKDQVYEIQLPKSINTTMCRLTLGPIEDSFHRYDMQIRVSLSGMETDAQWIPVR